MCLFRITFHIFSLIRACILCSKWSLLCVTSKTYACLYGYPWTQIPRKSYPTVMFIAYESLCTYTEGMFTLRLFVLQLMYCCLCCNCCIVNFVLCTLFSGGTWVYQEPFKHSFQWRNGRRKIEWILVCDFRILGSENMTQYLMQRNEMANRPNCNELSSILTTTVTSEVLLLHLYMRFYVFSVHW